MREDKEWHNRAAHRARELQWKMHTPYFMRSSIVACWS